ncbi:hypothetical protein KI387_040561, partial [Taxus chinensis]
DSINQKTQKLGVPAMGEDTTVDELIGPFEEYVKKEVVNLLSFTKGTLNFLLDIRASIALIVEKHSSWFRKCKDINSVADGWIDTLSFVCIPHADKVEPTTIARFSKELGGTEAFLGVRGGNQSG